MLLALGNEVHIKVQKTIKQKNQHNFNLQKIIFEFYIFIAIKHSLYYLIKYISYIFAIDYTLYTIHIYANFIQFRNIAQKTI